ncbi:hypothetical protein Pla110_01770 [Polystyrenella longa]|uniref:DUF1559 domain-containing protein n=1 Tax=Polystyrenella longa TaxID=2528007 RepID=A0A518CGX3_9PLAN|nr:DUF1559 domain-containing protein [Polystyrenella longa]QDU78473.1 hypothetical protein Pla110_01770 [Polystyrenella longa]
MPSFFVRLGLLVLVMSVVGCSSTEEDLGDSPAARPKVTTSEQVDSGLLRIPQQEMGAIGDGKVGAISEEGEVVLSSWDSHSSEINRESNYFIMFRQRQGDEGYLTTGKFIQLPDEGDVKIKLNQGLDKLTTDHVLLAFRPDNVSNEFVEQFRATIPLSDPTPSDEPVSDQTLDEARIEAVLMQSKKNLRDIAIAMHTYSNEHGCFPPGVIYGPDGKPWHSWRTLLLPYLNQQTVYDLYDVTQPWDSPANQGISEINMIIYSDPLYGKNPDRYAHYGVGIGDETLMRGVEYDGTRDGFETALKQGVSLADVIDGTTNTLMAASISPADQIKWSEPRDVFIYQNVPEIDSKDGFAAPYQSNGQPSVLVGMSDGSVQTISKTTLTPDFLKSLLTINGKEVITSPTASSENKRPQVIIKLNSAGEESTAEFVLE